MQVNEEDKVILPSSIAMGITGTIVGATAAIVNGINEIKADRATKDDVAKNVLKESAGSGISSTIGAVAVGSFRLTNPILGGLSFAAITIGTKFLWDYATRPKNENE